jgi:MoaA/NifB/PqqE/SkfB family radical SAM enzyme
MDEPIVNRMTHDITLGQYEYLELSRKVFLSNKNNNPKAFKFLADYSVMRRKADYLRRKNEKEGRHIPTFLQCSITDYCNLHCKGCYARANLADAVREQLPTEKWGEIFTEAAELGIATVFFLGGEPMVRKDVIEEAAKHPEILFFIFTNSTLIDEKWVEFLDDHRNLIPLLSIEGFEPETDERRGEGVYAGVMKAMEAMDARDILFGVAITVTRANIGTVTSDAFIDEMALRGAKIIEYVEYVPVEMRELMITAEERDLLADTIERARSERDKMIVVSFPGDERKGNGCIAAGKAFFHISSAGDVEPCPFSPYSDTNMRDKTILEALESPFFKKLQNSGIQDNDHSGGGCSLFESRKEVEALLKETKMETAAKKEPANS